MTVFVTDHARARHRERTGRDASSVEHEWHDAKRVAGGSELFYCDECRYHEADGVVLLRRNEAIVTVLKWRRCTPEQRAGVREGVGV